jgi:predicted nucleotidyltransferase
LAHLRRLQEEGKVQKVETSEGPRYAVLPFLRCEWIEPGSGIKETWQSASPVDWRFPLVTRIPDERAQSFLVEWLDRAQARQLLPPPRSRFEPAAGGKHRLLQVLVYGSCARGDAGPHSDLDLLVRGDVPKRAFERLRDLAHEVALTNGRTPDIRLMDDATWDTSTDAFRRSIGREGKTVYSTDPEAPLLEASLAVPHA